MFEENELLEAARKGDGDSFGKLVIKYQSLVAATIIAMVGDINDAEDLGQETFLRFFKSLRSFRGDSSVGTYLVRIAINLSITELKRRKRQKKQTHNNGSNGWDRLATEAPTGEHDELRYQIQQAILKLEIRFRSVLVLRLIDGYSARETAKILNLPIGTVLSRLARAQIKLREILKPNNSGEYDEKKEN